MLLSFSVRVWMFFCFILDFIKTRDAKNAILAYERLKKEGWALWNKLYSKDFFDKVLQL